MSLFANLILQIKFMILAHPQLIILIIKISNINLVVKLNIENHADSGKSLLSLIDKLVILLEENVFQTQNVHNYLLIYNKFFELRI